MKQSHHEDAPHPAGKRPLLALSLLNLDMSALEAYADDLMKKNRIRTVQEEDIVRAAEEASLPLLQPENRLPEESPGNHLVPD